VAKANNLELEIVPTIPQEGVSKEYLELNPLGKVPSFQAKDGFFLTEAIAIAIYSTFRGSLSFCFPLCFRPWLFMMIHFFQLQLSLSEDYC
jgi:hypothetical protein